MISMSKAYSIRQPRMEGDSIAEISRKLEVSRDTVYKYLAMDDLSQSESTPIPLTPFTPPSWTGTVLWTSGIELMSALPLIFNGRYVAEGRMRTPGIVIQLDELEYFLPGLYPGVVLAVEGKLPFRGLEERLRDGVIARAALAGKRLDEPAILELPAKPARGVIGRPIRVHHESFFLISPFTALSRASIARFSLMRGDACHSTILREDESR